MRHNNKLCIYGISKMTFSIPNFDQAAFDGREMLPVSVDGYWSHPVTLHIELFDNKLIKRISHSTGGEEDHIDNLQAHANFADAIKSSIQFLKSLDDDYLIKTALDNRRKEQALYDAMIVRKEKEKQAAWDADTGFTHEQAVDLVEDLKNEVNEDLYGETEVEIPLRGGDNKTSFTVRATNTGLRTVFKLKGKRVSAADLVSEIEKTASFAWWLENIVHEEELAFGRREALEETINP